VKQPRRAPNHAERDKQQHVGDPRRHPGREGVAELPQHPRKSADKIRQSPPGKGLDAILHPGKQQEETEQRGHARCDHEQGADVERSRGFRKAGKHIGDAPHAIGTITYHEFRSCVERLPIRLCRTYRLSRRFAQKNF
jgi:hypothetical protein